MLRKIIFKNAENGAEMNMPVTPPSFEITTDRNMETVNIHAMGDVALLGTDTYKTIKLDFLIPAQKYQFVTVNEIVEPYAYISTFERFKNEGTVLRLIITDTTVNIPVRVQSITYKEQDGSNDLYMSLELCEYKELAAVKIEAAAAASSARAVEAPPATPQTYKIASGDTLGAICRRFYGSAGLAAKLATFNGIKNPNLIRAGSVLRLPDKSKLG
ncbi:LysM peptidoglycan-binding domain-containing protein [Anaeromassilibacillus senegalensis]|uniref:LysM peptidoglycan-binding domain-containing protein n=1 Tax=Anaeromassilibacillus senegalensis TaxID=1673717 RepID=UPI000681E845|nr:LysM domain-containing protein [Anaeromassilibacillus senegalensis]